MVNRNAFIYAHTVTALLREFGPKYTEHLMVQNRFETSAYKMKRLSDQSKFSRDKKKPSAVLDDLLKMRDIVTICVALPGMRKVVINIKNLIP